MFLVEKEYYMDNNFYAILMGQPTMMPHAHLDIDFENLHLVPPSFEYMDSFKAAVLEFMAHRVEEFSYPKLSTVRDERAFLCRLEKYRKGKVSQGHVPSSAFWLVDGKNYLGSGDVRHYLNDNLRRLGGNIGYAIRPGAWQKGLGTKNLALLLEEARKLGVTKPIITCFETNLASIKIIEANGGRLIGTANNRVKAVLTLTRIYEIDLC